MAESPSRRYHTISETAELLDVKPHVLRYWESQFPALRPRKNRGGIRMYQEHDIDIIRTIREMLYDRGYTIAGARKKLREEQRRAEAEARSQMDIDFIPPKDRKHLRQIREELVSLRDRLLKDAVSSSRRTSAVRRAATAGEKSVDPPDGQG